MTATAEGLVRVENLSYRYPQHGLGLSHVDLTAREGEIWVITGRSGCGKSTLARCIAGLIPHLYRGEMEGTVWIGERNTRETPLWELARDVGMVFQNPEAQSLSSSVEQEMAFGLEQLGLPSCEMGPRIDDCLARFGLDALRARTPDTLSGGEMQRLMLAAALARRPRVLVLDEPLSMLDSSAASDFMQHLSVLAGAGTTILAFEHRANWLRQLPDMHELALGNGLAADNAPGTLAPAPLPAASEIQVRDLTISFARQHLFEHLNLTLRPGEVTAIVGRNGVGKTTLLRVMAGLKRSRGHILTATGDAPQLGLMFQNADWQLFNPSVRDEIRYRVERPDEALYAWLLQALGLAAYESTPPLLLSEGEKKRLALAVLLMRGGLHGILMDEPTLGQDDVHRRLLGDVSHALAHAGTLVVAATHDLEWVRRYCERTILLAPGRVAADGPTGEVFRDAGAWAESDLVLPSWLKADES